MDYQDYLKFLLALVIVLSLMWGLAYLLKRFGFGHTAMISPKNKRLKIIEILPVDARRKAVLIQRDDTQHLVLLSATGETVIETNIKPPKETAQTRDTKH